MSQRQTLAARAEGKLLCISCADEELDDVFEQARKMLQMSGIGSEKVSADDPLFQDPPPREDCPICMLPMPIDPRQYHFKICCGQLICCSRGHG